MILQWQTVSSFQKYTKPEEPWLLIGGPFVLFTSPIRTHTPLIHLSSKMGENQLRTLTHKMGKRAHLRGQKTWDTSWQGDSRSRMWCLNLSWWKVVITITAETLTLWPYVDYEIFALNRSTQLWQGDIMNRRPRRQYWGCPIWSVAPIWSESWHQTPLATTPKCDSRLPHTGDCQHRDGDGEMKKITTVDMWGVLDFL